MLHTLDCQRPLISRLLCSVTNKLGQPMSVHWHGILQRGSVIMDGVAGITQRAIPGSASQLYTFVCVLPGTYWYHSPFKGQVSGRVHLGPWQPALPAIQALANRLLGELASWL